MTVAPEHTPREIRIIFLGLMIGMLLPAMTATIVSTALPSIVSDLGGLSDLSWIVTAYMLSSTVCIPLVGKTSDIFGRRPLYLMAIVVYVVGSVLCGLAQSVEQLTAARVLQGIGGGSLFALSYATIGDVVPARQRGRYQGYIGVMYAVATLAGPLIGGFIVDHLSWRWVFFVNVPLGLAAIGVAHRYLRISHDRLPGRIDYAGAALVTADITALLLIAVWGGQQYAWDSPMIVTLWATVLVATGLLVPVERRAHEPVVPVRLFRHEVFAVGSVLMFLQGIGLMGPLVFIPTFFQVVTGASATLSGLMLLPLMAGMVLTSTFAGRLVTRSGRYKPYPMLGAALLLLGFLLLSTMDARTGYGEAAAYLAIVGLGVGFSRQVIILAVQNAVDFRDLGVATSATQLFHMLGATLGLAAFGAIINLRVDNWVVQRLPEGLPGGLRVDEVASNPAMLAELPARIESIMRDAVADAISFTFLAGVPVLALALVMAVLLREIPLNETIGRDQSPRAGDPAP